jgi:Raf kinase inhibitor-like YbhB/YbcL family protein
MHSAVTARRTPERRFRHLCACSVVGCLALLVLTSCGGTAPTNTPLPRALPLQSGVVTPLPPTALATAAPQEMIMELTSSAFSDGAEIPRRYTCDAEDISPPLSWTAPPRGTASLVLICEDPDARAGTWVHWVLYGLRPDTVNLPEGIPGNEVIHGGVKQGLNDFRSIGYGGPCPPRGPAHRYVFTLCAVDIDLTLGPGATEAEVLQAIKGHILAEAQYTGRYQRA